MSKQLRQWAALLLVLALTLLWGKSDVLAQSGTEQIELVGVIEAINGGTTLIVNSLTVDISTAEVRAPLEVGQAVKVEGELLDDGTILAREVKAVAAGLLPDELEMIGPLDNLNAATAIIGGLTFDITKAELEPGLTVGEIVKVHANLSETGVWTAREIERVNSEERNDDSSDQNDDFEIVGTLEQVGDGFVMVAGLRIDTQTAEIYEPLVIGSLVKVEGNFVDGGLAAREVKPAITDDSNDSSDDDGSNDDSDDNSSRSDACQFKIEASSANLRSGPGTGYDVTGYTFEDSEFAVLEVHTSGEWIKVANNTGEAWVAVSVGELEENCSGLPTSNTPFRGEDESGDDDHSGDDSSDDSHDDSSSDDGPNHDSDDDHRDDSSGRSDDDSHDDDSGHDDSHDDD